MPAVGAGAFEIRVHVLGEWRAIYVAKFKDAVTSCTPSARKRRKPARNLFEPGTFDPWLF
jgi:hypothetical protein